MVHFFCDCHVGGLLVATVVSSLVIVTDEANSNTTVFLLFIVDLFLFTAL